MAIFLIEDSVINKFFIGSYVDCKMLFVIFLFLFCM